MPCRGVGQVVAHLVRLDAKRRPRHEDRLAQQVALAVVERVVLGQAGQKGVVLLLEPEDELLQLAHLLQDEPRARLPVHRPVAVALGDVARAVVGRHALAGVVAVLPRQRDARGGHVGEGGVAGLLHVQARQQAPHDVVAAGQGRRLPELADEALRDGDGVLGGVGKRAVGHGAHLAQRLVGGDGVVGPLVAPGDVRVERGRVDAFGEGGEHLRDEVGRDGRQVLVDDAAQQGVGVHHEPLDGARGVLVAHDEGARRLVVHLDAVAAQGGHGLLDERAHDEAPSVALGQGALEPRPRARAQLEAADGPQKVVGRREP